jgi:hypothetical protein
MINKVFLLIISSLAASMLLADNTGCGLGTMLFKGRSGPIYELSAVSTNDSASISLGAPLLVPGGQAYGAMYLGFVSTNSNTIAISMGTSEYQEGERIIVAEVNQYVDQNMDMLAADISRGKGEYIDTLADIMQVERKLAFKYKLKKNFDKIYTHEDITSSEVVHNIYQIHKS